MFETLNPLNIKIIDNISIMDKCSYENFVYSCGNDNSFSVKDEHVAIEIIYNRNKRKIKEIAFALTSIPEKNLFIERQIYGWVVLQKTRYGFWETHSRLIDRLHGRGFGTRLYAEAIDHAVRNGYDVRSSRHPTVQAQHVWTSRKLNDLFVIKQKRDRFVVLGFNQ